jgi:hypothetical protein
MNTIDIEEKIGAILKVVKSETNEYGQYITVNSTKEKESPFNSKEEYLNIIFLAEELGLLKGNTNKQIGKYQIALTYNGFKYFEKNIGLTKKEGKIKGMRDYKSPNQNLL